MKEYKLSKDSNETFLVDSDPCKVIESYLESLPSKGEPWIETQNRSGKLTRIYHGVCPYCNNPTFLVGYETRNNNSSVPYMRHYKKSVPLLAEYNETAYRTCILASGNFSSFGDLSKNRKKTDPLSTQILNTVKSQLDRIFYILEQDTSIYFSPNQKIQMLRDYLSASGYNYSSSYINNLPWTFANVLKAKNLYHQRIKANSDVDKVLSLLKNIRLDPIGKTDLKRINSDGQSFINLFCEFRNLRIDKKSGEQSIDFRIYTKTKNSIDEIYKKAFQINLTRFTNLINRKRSDYRQEQWEEMKAKIDEIQ